MPKNIVIFSDGTGQAGGLKPDQNLSNIYKLYRACRSDHESDIDPAQQVAFYDAGLGTEADGGPIPFKPLQTIRKLYAGATGTGLMRNVADCYGAIVKHYEPGDRIYLFGFSRGAYTARCVGGVLGLCGVPSRGLDGGPVPRYGEALRKIADEAVQKIYEHGAGRGKDEHTLQRKEKARRFRDKYASNDSDGNANVVPYFIGVFDTVASLGAPLPRRLLMLAGLASVTAVGAYIAASIGTALFGLPTKVTTWTLLGLGALMMGVDHIRSHFKWISDYPRHGKFDWHFSKWRFKFYDENLNPRVQFARHALAIDETRKDFDRVRWASFKDRPERPGEPEWLRQVWFAGNHSDIGGSYAQDESRLSDIALDWMVQQTQEPSNKLLIDFSRLKLFPDPLGMQHCEVNSMRDSVLTWLPRERRPVWSQKLREINPEAPLHPSVLERFNAVDGAPFYGLQTRYRPANLTFHHKVAGFYEVAPGVAVAALNIVSPESVA
ncbi:DUF2235 domain-containing protein [Caenimonas sedimenti]|uniref:DUF2235 domain-containing protein n=1 Tax=Caenimonas sedimenti TaxID=2596921 RepID=A0A562ZI40_9BURK|nr:DUF2235 domain-containing protein [Caenimonas sedimenti]TWO68071.1 DUF2235 domain-containing protein [Caenimonas sedimenti]